MDSSPSEPRRGLLRHVQDRVPAFLATLVGGAVAIGVNVPLDSPYETLANSASIGIVSVIVAVLYGMIWARLNGDPPQRARRFNIVITAVLLLATGASAFVENFEGVGGTLRYVIPLAVIVTIVASVGTPMLERVKASPWAMWTSFLLAIALVVVGYVMFVNEVGFTEAPSLSLPPPPAG